MNTPVIFSNGHAVFIDLDDTLIFTRQLATRAEMVVANLNDAKGARALEEAGLSTESFDPIKFMKQNPKMYLRWSDNPATKEVSDHLIEDRFLKVFTNLREVDQKAFRRPDADGLLSMIAGAAEYHEVLTYGSFQWQILAKMKAAGLYGKVPYRTVETRNKSELLSTWRRGDGGFVIPTEKGIVAVRNVIIVDDNSRNFKDLPEGAFGIEVVNEYKGRGETMFGWRRANHNQLMWGLGRKGAMLAYEELIKQGMIISAKDLDHC